MTIFVCLYAEMVENVNLKLFFECGMFFFSNVSFSIAWLRSRELPTVEGLMEDFL